MANVQQLLCFLSVFLIFIYSTNGGVVSGAVSGVITTSVFNTFLPRSNSNEAGCDSHGFYTYSAFLEAASSFDGFGATATELAAFFSHVAHGTGSGCSINEINPPKEFGQYYARGPLQLAWDYNYKAAGDYLHQDLIHNPNLLSTNNVLSFKASLWFWMTQGPHKAMVSGQGFGATIRAINSGECVPGDARMQHRVNLYRSFCSNLGVDPGNNISCA